MKKYLPFVIGYVIYASIVLIVIADERGHNFWEPFLGWLITIPLIITCIVCWGWDRHKKAHSSDEKDNNENLLFIENWTLIDFAKKWGPEMKAGTCVNEKTGKYYKSCVFTQKDGTKTYVSFFHKLGELTASEILLRKDELKVGLTKNGKYYLHNGNVKAWENVDLGL